MPDRARGRARRQALPRATPADETRVEPMAESGKKDVPAVTRRRDSASGRLVRELAAAAQRHIRNLQIFRPPPCPKTLPSPTSTFASSASGYNVHERSVWPFHRTEAQRRRQPGEIAAPLTRPGISSSVRVARAVPRCCPHTPSRLSPVSVRGRQWRTPRRSFCPRSPPLFPPA